MNKEIKSFEEGLAVIQGNVQTSLDIGGGVGWSFKFLSKQSILMLIEDAKSNTSLLTLDLRWNDMRNKGAQAVSDLLRVHPKLSRLYLRKNVIGREGGVALANALAVNKTLRMLDLDDNRLEHVAAKALGAALRKNKTLRRIWLTDNNIQTDGAMELIAALRVNRSLIGLTMGNNGISEPAGRDFVEMLRSNYVLRNLFLPSNYLFPSTNYEIDIYTRRNQMYSRAAQFFAMSLLCSDEYLQVTAPAEHSGVARFFSIVARLPFDVQCIACHRAADSTGEFMFTGMIKTGLDDVLLDQYD